MKRLFARAFSAFALALFASVGLTNYFVIKPADAQFAAITSAVTYEEVAEPPGGGGDNLFVADFSTPGASTNYNFAGGFSEGGNWTKAHETNCGPSNEPCANITWANGASQYGYGWWTPTLDHTFTNGDAIYIRMAIRFHDATRWVANGAPRSKMVILGSGSSRTIIYMNAPGPTVGGALGWRVGGVGSYYAHAIPSYFGISGNDDWTGTVDGLTNAFGSMKIGKNITTDAAGPVLMTYGSNASPPVCGADSAAPTDGWYWLQFMAQSGDASTHSFAVWCNNNDEMNPTTVVPSGEKTEILDATNWEVNPNLGIYIDQDPGVTGAGYRIMSFEIGMGFDDTYYPGSAVIEQDTHATFALDRAANDDQIEELQWAA